MPMERPALNPASNVKAKKPPPLGGLSYEKDPNRPGGGVFVAHGKAKGAYLEVDGVIVEGHSDDDDDEGEVMSVLLKEDRLTREVDDAPSARAHDHESGGRPAAAQDGNANVNPVLNEGGMPESAQVQVMNLLDSAPGPASTRALEQFAMADNNWLDGIPGGMFDWGA